MRILLVAATSFEVHHQIRRFGITSILPGLYVHLDHPALRIDLLTPGIGMTPTAFYLGKYLRKEDYDLAINAGICGSYLAGLTPGTVVRVTEECLPESGIAGREGFHSFFETGLQDPDQFPWKNGILRNEDEPELPLLKTLPALSGNTVHTLHTDPERIQALLTQFPASVESMEGAAFLYACQLSDIPCIQIRAVSNYVGERDKSKWELKKAIKNMDETLMKLWGEVG